MPKRKKGIRELAQEAGETAKEDFYKSLKKKPRRKYTKREHIEGEQPRSPTAKWITDEWGRQGEVYFDGYNYWGVGYTPDKKDSEVKHVVSIRWTPEEWEKRKLGEVKKDDTVKNKCVKKIARHAEKHIKRDIEKNTKRKLKRTKKSIKRNTKQKSKQVEKTTTKGTKKKKDKIGKKGIKH